MATRLFPFIMTGTIGAGLQATETFLVGNQVINIHQVTLVNETRPQTDPRPCWVHVLEKGSTVGSTIALGTCSNYNDYIKDFPQPRRCDRQQQVKFEVIGENGDAYKVSMLYEVIEIG